MTAEESKILQQHLQAAAAILLKNTPKEQLKDFAIIELAVRRPCTNTSSARDRKFLKTATAKQGQGD